MNSHILNYLNDVANGKVEDAKERQRQIFYSSLVNIPESTFEDYLYLVLYHLERKLQIKDTQIRLGVQGKYMIILSFKGKYKFYLDSKAIENAYQMRYDVGVLTEELKSIIAEEFLKEFVLN